jgi:hypothetical protein
VFGIVSTIVIGLMRSVFGLSPSTGGAFAPAGQIQAPAGTAAAPSYAFAAQTGAGMWYSGSFGLTFSVAGSAMFAHTGGGLLLAPAGKYGWNSNSFSSASVDTNLVRVAAGVVGGDTSPATWIQNGAGRVRNTADVTNATATLANLTDLTVTLKAGRKYTGRLVLVLNESTAADGAKVDLNGGTATMTSVEFGVAAALAATVGVRTSTALATAVTLTALGDTNDVIVEIPITLVCNVAGTLIPRQAQNAHSTGTLTTRAGSYLHLDDSAN